VFDAIPARRPDVCTSDVHVEEPERAVAQPPPEGTAPLGARMSRTGLRRSRKHVKAFTRSRRVPPTPARRGRFYREHGQLSLAAIGSADRIDAESHSS